MELKSKVSNKKVSGKVFLISKEGGAPGTNAPPLSLTRLAEMPIGESRTSICGRDDVGGGGPGIPGLAAGKATLFAVVVK